MKKVLCLGSFDILHQGHLEFLQDAKSKGDKLYVLVMSDNSIFNFKGKNPVNSQKKRVKVLEKTGIPDKVIAGTYFAENLQKILKARPDIMVFGYDQKSVFERKIRSFLKGKGLKTKFVFSKKFSGGLHSSDLRKSIELKH